jgi:hypothetical protein
MNSLGFKQSNILTDIRLAIGFTACAIAGATFYYDYTLGWDKTKAATLYAVAAYFTLNTLLTWWIWWVEGGKVYIGERDGVKVLSRRAVFRAGWRGGSQVLICAWFRSFWRAIRTSIRRCTSSRSPRRSTERRQLPQRRTPSLAGLISWDTLLRSPSWLSFKTLSQLCLSRSRRRITSFRYHCFHFVFRKLRGSESILWAFRSTNGRPPQKM